MPGYPASSVYINRINGVSVYAPRVSPPNTYVNRGHLTLMRQDAFVNARPVRQGRLAVAPRSMLGAPVTNVLNIAPQRASVLGYVENPARVARPPAALANRSVVVRSGLGTSRVGAARVRATAPVIQAMSKAEKTRLEQLRKQQLKQQLKQQQAQKKIDEQRRKQAAKAQRQRQRQLAKQQLRQAAKSAAKSSPAASSGSKK
jgi:hypothetical protein